MSGSKKPPFFSHFRGCASQDTQSRLKAKNKEAAKKKTNKYDEVIIEFLFYWSVFIIVLGATVFFAAAVAVAAELLFFLKSIIIINNPNNHLIGVYKEKKYEIWNLKEGKCKGTIEVSDVTFKEL